MRVLVFSPTILRSVRWQSSWASASERHKALNYFLLKNELEPARSNVPKVEVPKVPAKVSADNALQSDTDNSSSQLDTGNSSEQNAFDFARYTLMPVVDRYWMPEPMLYKQLNYSPELLYQLDQMQAELQLTFKTRLLLLQAFTLPSFVSRHVADTPGKNRESWRLLSQDRLIHLGETQLRLALGFYTYNRFPTATSKSAQSLMDHVCGYRILGALAQDIASFQRTLMLVLEDEEGTRDRVAAETLKALLGALYLDQGSGYALAFIFEHVLPKVSSRRIQPL